MQRFHNRISTRFNESMSTNAARISFLLGLVNIIIFVLSLIVLLGGAFFIKFGTGNQDSIRDWWFANVPIICFGSVGVLFSIFGFITSCCGASNRLLIATYEIICILLFLSHVSAFIYFWADWSEFEEDHARSLHFTMGRINTGKDVDRECDYNMKRLSTLLYCCGENGTSDFKNKLAPPSRCCAQGMDFSGKGGADDSGVPGCADLSTKRLRKFWNMFFFTPSCFLFLVELCAIAFLPLMMRKMAMLEEGGGTAIYKREVTNDN